MGFIEKGGQKYVTLKEKVKFCGHRSVVALSLLAIMENSKYSACVLYWKCPASD